MIRIFFVFVLLWISFSPAESATASLQEAQVFEWWDNGIVTPEEANEMLSLLDEGNNTEACLLAEVYAQFSCEGDSPSPADSLNSADSSPSIINPSGYFMWKARLDSSGHLVSHREELMFKFYRFRLRLGSQELLSYSNDGSEAHFGDISTREIHSHIPVDTLWGTSFLYPLGAWSVGGLLDSSKTVQGRIGLKFDRKNSMDVAYWHRAGSRAGDRAQANSSVVLQTRTDFGQASGWWQADQAAPLIKIQLHGKNIAKSTDKLPSSVGIDWRTTAYFHEDSVPALAHLSSTILGSRLWGSQTIAATWPDAFRTKVTAAARLLNPLHTDSISTRLKMEVQSGPAFLRGTASTTCIEAGNNCIQTDWKAGLTAKPLPPWTLGASVKVRYTREGAGSTAGFGSPRLETHVLYEDSPRNYVKLTLTAPDGNPASRLQFQDELHLSGGFLDFSLVNTFASTPDRDFHPTRSSIVAKVLF